MSNFKKPSRNKKAVKQPATPKKMGRPSRFSQEIMDRIIVGISNGKTLTSLCEPDDMPGVRTGYDWLEADKELSAHFARARDAGHDVIAEEALRIADTPTRGIITKVTPDGTHIIEEDMLGHRRLQVETRLKLLAKWSPKKYGDKIQADVTHDVGDPLAKLIRDIRAKRDVTE